MNPMQPKPGGSRSSGLLPPIRNNDIPGTFGESQQTRARAVASLKEVEEQENIFKYLEKHKDFLESYVCNYVPQDVVEKWLFKKMNPSCVNMSVTSNVQTLNYKLNEMSSKKYFFVNIIRTLKNDPTEHAVIWEMAKCIATSIGVDAYRVFKLYPDHVGYVEFFAFDHTKSPYDQPVPKNFVCPSSDQVVLVLEAAKTGDCKRFSRTDNPVRFPSYPQALFRTFKTNNARTANHVMYQPILSSTGQTKYVIEMWRARDRFKVSDQEISSNFVVWGGLALHYSNLYLDKQRAHNMTDFLLDVVKAIFEDMMSLNQVMKKILEFAQRLVNADRASVFLADYKKSELVASVFDLKVDHVLDKESEKKEVRIPMSRGIAGYVALSGKKVNVPDAYSDYRFNREVDDATGYKTETILCMPVKAEGKVVGVVQMVNKKGGGTFSHEDEASFDMFSAFFGLALHHAHLYDKITRKEQKYKVALEVLSYHNTCKEDEVVAMVANKKKISINLNNFYLDPYKLDQYKKCKSLINMCYDLFGATEFDPSTLTRFILTVRKNYRDVPYHNFDHGWSVAHAMYVILKSDSKNRFTKVMRLALFVAALCHDLDHRGYTNKYMCEIASPLASMYSTSTLEHHHFNITVTILQQDGHNIFSHLSKAEYKEILGFIKLCILASDLAVFLPNLKQIKELCGADDSEYDWKSVANQKLAMAISMTAADLSASAKPWMIQNKTVKVIFEEFYEQGDKERAAGKDPIPMMDRNKPDQQPASQVGFLSQICVPCYEVLQNILPNTKPMYEMALKNLNQWKSRVEDVKYKSNNITRFEVVSDEALADSSDESDEKSAAPTSKADIITRLENMKHLVDVKAARNTIKSFMRKARAKAKLLAWNEKDEYAETTSVTTKIFWEEVSSPTQPKRRFTISDTGDRTISDSKI